MSLTRAVIVAGSSLALLVSAVPGAAADDRADPVVLDTVDSLEELKPMRVAFCLSGPNAQSRYDVTAEALEPDDSPDGEMCAIADVPDAPTGPTSSGTVSASRATSEDEKHLGSTTTSDPTKLNIPISVCNSAAGVIRIVVPRLGADNVVDCTAVG
ncbi:hypothetical protein [Actinokineospora iranica]|uniref:Uncharacterized protein n=1 Tax=Actinokineospora iranica TaxID=1271860 RepID=A0A1G6SKI9_9PSEU|nr:hypothetical protein [Actinokineospora iranica]SDD17389.1 hypothetical protein SAMN05216174_10836 [Actinokineospora iranica]